MKKNFSLYLIIIKLAVLQVCRGGDSAHTGIGVVIRVLTNTVWETFLKKVDRRQRTEFFLVPHILFNINPLSSYRHSGSQQRAGRVGHVASFSFILHQDVCSPAASVHLPLLLDTHRHMC